MDIINQMIEHYEARKEEVKLALLDSQWFTVDEFVYQVELESIEAELESLYEELKNEG